MNAPGNGYEVKRISAITAQHRPLSREKNHHSQAMPRKKACPACGSDGVLPIMYGYPAPGAISNGVDEEGNEVTLDSHGNEIAMGGCIVEEGAPNFECKKCGHRWKE